MIRVVKKVMGYQEIKKTIDPRYSAAKESLKILQQDTEKLVGSMSQMLSQIRDLSKVTMKIGIDLGEWSEYFENDKTKERLLTVESFSRSFDNLTANFLIPRIQPAIIKPLALFQSEVERLTKEKVQIKQWRYNYDYNRTYYEYYKSRKYSNKTVEKYQKEMESAHEEYSKYNEDFIDSIKKLSDERNNQLLNKIREFVSIISQYYLMIFKEVQKFKTTFPSETSGNDPQPKRKLSEFVFQEEEEEVEVYQMNSSTIY